MDVAEQESARSFLRKCAAVYEALVDRVLRLEAKGDDEATLKWLSLAAGVAWAAHPGRFADERLEAVARRAGQRLEPLNPAPSEIPGAAITAGGRRRVLHVATTVYDVGGHTRLIENWVRNDPGTLHSLVLLDQQHHRIRAELAARVAASGGELIVLPPRSSLLDRVRRLRHVAHAGYDCIILHHHPHDVVPLVAFATAKGPPVAVMNHADHVFWLGASVADAVIDFRPFGSRLSRERRGARQGLTLPLPLNLSLPALDRAAARARLGTAAEEVVLFSMGAAYKYRPTRTQNFFRTLHKVLADNPAARLYIAGVSPNDLRSFGIPGHERLETLGVVNDPGVYQAAADLYLEGFPYGSSTALFETAALGVCPVLMYAPTPQLDHSGEEAMKGLVASPTDETDYVARLTALINDPAARTQLGQAVAGRIASINNDIARAYLQPIYDRLAATTHQPQPLPAQASAETEEDLNLAGFNSSSRKTAVLQQGADYALSALTISDLLRVLAMSIRMGDTRPSPLNARRWLGVLRRKAFPPRVALDVRKM